MNPTSVNDATLTTEVRPDARGPAVLRAQILLDRAHFSPGEMDAHYGDNLRVAVTGYQAAHEMKPTGVVDAATWKTLNADTEPAMVAYTIKPEDVAGPFDKIPAEMPERAKLKSLGYESAGEELGERFHIHPKLLADLNPGKDLTKAGEEIMAPNIRKEEARAAGSVTVSKAKRAVTAYGTDQKLLAQYPATIGSEHDPLPVGEWKVAGVQQDPWFNYNPALFWDAKPDDAKARIPPGPNNPVGVVWIGLTKEHYGIHGTPEPGTIGHSESHGCIRLTNWDAEELSKMLKHGTPVTLQE